MSPPPTGEVVVEAREVVAGFGANTVLHGVNLSVERGACVGIFGLNGAGKSVTMKCLAGLVPVRTGTIELFGQDVTAEPPEARVPRGVAYLPQARQLFPRLTVEQNLRLGGYVMRRHDKARYASIVDDVYSRFPRLAERRTQLAGSMSGGEQAMLAIGRALASDPQILLIDEPSAGLAPAVMDDVLAMLLQLRAEGLTILLVEQNISFGFRLVERAAILQRGLVVYEGDVAHLDTARVAELLGVGRLLSKQLSASTARTTTATKPRRTPKKKVT
ncbi:MAG: transporter ATP-binding protein [Frankiales bacterium]|nr:transporter ATP-binding protein [Frankiales bacterium]